MNSSPNELELGAGGAAAPVPSQDLPNRLQPGRADGGLEAAPPSPPASDMMSHFDGMQDQAAARYAKMKQAVGTLDKVRKELDGLVALGDTVTQEDVVKAGSGLVAAGLGAAAVAGILADMPESGEQLQAWVAQHEQETQQREVQAQQALAITRHESGLTAFRHLIGHSAEAGAQQPQPAPSNPMQPQPQADAPQESSNAG